MSFLIVGLCGLTIGAVGSVWDIPLYQLMIIAGLSFLAGYLFIKFRLKESDEKKL